MGLSVCFAVVSGYVSRVTASGVAGSADGASTVGESGAGATCSEGERAERADTLLIAVVGGAGNGGPNTVGPRRHGAQQAADAKFSNALSIPTGIDLISLTTNVIVLRCGSSDAGTKFWQQTAFTG